MSKSELVIFLEGELAFFFEGELVVFFEGELAIFLEGELVTFLEGELALFFEGELVIFLEGELALFFEGELVVFFEGELAVFLKGELVTFLEEHGRMILEAVEHGPLIWPTSEENGVTRIKKYEELSATEKIQADCDLKATNIILQGLPSDVYSLVNHHRVATDLWERVQLLMQGTSLTKQERECKLYDAFDKFAHIKGESLHQYYLRFTQLINDINIYKMKLEQFKVNTKFLNSLPPKWSKFLTDVKLSSQYGSIHPKQHYSTTYPSTPHAITYPSTLHPNAYSSTVLQDACRQPQSIPQIEYIVSIINQQTHLAKFPQINSGLAIPVFKQGDDPIDTINKMMSFLSTVGRQSSFAAGTSGTRANISKIGRNNSGQQRVVKCFNCQGEAQGSGKVLNEEELEFLTNPGVAEGPVTQMVITHNAAYQADDLDAYDSNCDDFSTAKAVLMANLSSYGSDVLSKRTR
ncbi:hypothetical protein Tco_1350957 [Tanacetum coccineum]